jgi:DNA-binding response OmpR family regulator
LLAGALDAFGKLPQYLREHGFAVEFAESADECLQSARSLAPDLMILARNVGHASCSVVCALLRSEKISAPIVIWSPASEDAAIAGLEAGANDFIAEPISPEVLLARCRAHFRAYADHREAVLRIGAFEFRPSARVLSAPDSQVHLTDMETRLLKRLHRAGGRRVSREELLLEIWGYHRLASSHTVETHVYRLRRKMESLTDGLCLLMTEDEGYSLDLAVPEPLSVARAGG